ncbi:MAG TPA: pentapeptide repeat-containing protein, partial [Pyrinomonadaceae bacterium]
MTSRTANKIKQRRESFKENQTPVVVRKPNKELFSLLAGTSVVVIIFLSYLGYYRSDFTNELIIPIIVAVTVLLLLIIWYLPKFYVRSLPIETGKDFDREKERLKLEDDTRKTFAQIVGGIVFLGGLIFTYNTFRLQQEGQFTDRFTKAVAQLGDDKLEIRLGGLYALERIAKDSPKDHWTVMEILSAYIRESTKKKEEIAENNSNKPANVNVNETKKNEKITTDIQAALTIVGRRKIEQDSKTDKINLSGANLNRSNLNGSNLRKADLREANLIEASLREASLREADLFGAD